MKKFVVFCLALLMSIAGAFAQIPYYGAPFFKQGFDNASLSSLNWTQEGTLYASTGTSETTTAWATTNTYSPAGKNFVNVDANNTHSLLATIAIGNGLVGSVTSPEIANAQSSVCVGFSLFNPTSPAIFPVGYGYLAFQISKDNGATWDELWRTDGQETGYSAIVTSLTGTGTMIFAGWYTIQVNLPASYNNKNFKLRFHVNSPDLRTTALEMLIDGVFASKLYTNDAKIESIGGFLTSGTNAGAYFQEPITVNFTNRGTAPIYSIDLKYTVTPGDQSITETYYLPEPLTQDNTTSYTFNTPANLSSVRTTYTLQVQTALLNDQYNANDKISYTIKNSMTNTPYATAFLRNANDDIYDEWKFIQGQSPGSQQTTFPAWSISTFTYGTNALDTCILCDASTKTVDADAYAYSRPLLLHAGKRYELKFSTATKSTDVNDKNTLQIFLSKRVDSLSREGEPLFYRSDINNVGYLNQRVIVAPEKDTSYCFVFRALSAAGSKQLYVFDVAIREIADMDVEVTTLVDPQNMILRYSNAETVTVKMTNVGLQPFNTGSMHAYFQLDGGTITEENVASTTLEVNQSINHIFATKVDMTRLKDYNFKTWISSVSDEIGVNDMISPVITPKVTTLPYNGTLGSNLSNRTYEEKYWENVDNKWLISSLGTMVRWQYGGTTSIPATDTATLYSRPIAIKAGQICEISYDLARSAAQTATLDVKVYTKSGDEFMHVGDIQNINITTAASAFATQTSTFTPTADGDYYFAFIAAPPTGGLKCNVFIRNPYFNQIYIKDISLEKILFPGDQVAGLDSLPIGVIVKNNGKDAITTSTVSYQINNGAVVTETIPGTIATGVQKIYYFANKAVFTGTGTESIKIWGTLAADENAADDTLRMNVQNVAKATIPYTITDFSTVNDWLAFDQNHDAVTWQKLSDETGFSYNSTNTANDYLVTKQMNLQAGKIYKVSFEALASAANKPFNLSLMYGKGNNVESLISLQNYTNIVETTAERPLVGYIQVTETAGYVVGFRVNGTTNIATIANKFSVTEVSGYPNAEVQIAYPAGDGVFSQTDSIVINIKNIGQDIIQQFPVTCKLNGATIASTTLYETIPVSGTYRFVVRNLNMMTPQTYNIEAYTHVLFDSNEANDTARVTRNCIPWTDMQMEAIVAPISGKTNAAATVTVSVKNVGNVPVSEFPISYTMNGNTVTETISASVAPLTSYQYTFAQTLNLSAVGTYDIKMYVSATGDENHVNDTLSTMIHTTNQTVDVAMLSIISPVDGVLTNAETVTVSVRNNTNIPLTVPVICTIDEGQQLSGSVNIPASSTVSYSFSEKANMSQVKTYNLVASTVLPNDEVSTNNEITKEVSYIKRDMGITYIVSPTMQFECSNATPIVVEIRNYGVNSMTSIPVTYKINNAASVTETVTFSPYLSPGAVVHYTFNQKANMSLQQDYRVTAYTTLSDDVNHMNDTATMLIKLGYGDPALPVMASNGQRSASGSKSHVLADGSLFVRFWQGSSNGYYNLYAQLLNQSGTPQFAGEGILISNNERTYSIVNTSDADKEGNLLMGYTNLSTSSESEPNGELRLSKLSRTGEHMFGTNGAVIVPASTSLAVATFIRTDSRSYIYLSSNKGILYKVDKNTGAIIKFISQGVSAMEFDDQDKLYVTYKVGTALMLQIFDTNLNPTLSSPIQIAESGADGASILVFDTEKSQETGLWVCYESYSYAGTFFIQYLNSSLVPQIGSSGVPVSNATSRYRIQGWPAVTRGAENALAFAFSESVTGGYVYNYVKGQVISKTGVLKWGNQGKDLFPPSPQTEMLTMGLAYNNDTLYLSKNYYQGSGGMLSTNMDLVLFDKEFNAQINSVRYASSIYDARMFTFTPNSYGVFVSWSASAGIGTPGFINAQHVYFDKTLQNKKYSVTVGSDNYEMGYAVGGGLFDANGKANMKATPVPGYRFKAWKRGATTASSVNPYIFNVTGNTALTAVFELDSYTITATAGAGGSITPSGNIEVLFGGSKIFNIVPSIGYKISQVLVDGVNVPAAVTSGIYTFSNVSANHTISAQFEQLRYTIAATATTGGSILPSGNIVVTYGTDRTFNIIEQFGYQLKEVLVDGVNVPEAVASKEYTFTYITNNHTIAAIFERITHVITATAEAGGTITPSGNIVINHGDNQTFAIMADPGYAIHEVLVDGVNVLAAVYSGSYTFINIREAHTITATFNQAAYTITATSGAGGTVSPNGVTGANHGDSKPFFIVPNAGYAIAQVLIDGAPNSEAMSGVYTFTNISASHTISATFEYSYSTIMATADEGGTIAPAGASQVSYGGSKFYTITPSAGYKIAQVLVDGMLNAAAVETGTYLFTNVTTSHSIHATFTHKSYDISASCNEGGTISPAGTTTLNYGGSQVYTITTATGYTLTQVLVDGVSIGTPTTYTFSNVIANHSIRAIFEIKKYDITATAGAGGTIFPTGITTVNYGGEKAYSFHANEGYKLKEVLVDGSNNAAAVTSGTYTFSNVTANHTIAANFEVIQFTVTASIEGANGSITPTGAQTVNYGDEISFTITPNEGYEIDKVLVDGISRPGAVASGEFAFSGVMKDHTITASFTPKTGINEGDITSLAVYPNPTTGELKIMNGELRMNTILVFDITGKLLMERKNVDNTQTTIDISEYAQGIYFFNVDGKVVKVVKQ